MKQGFCKWTSASIRELRERLGLTQKEFARLIGAGRQQTVSDWEIGVHAISRAYQIILDDIERTLDNEKTKER